MDRVRKEFLEFCLRVDLYAIKRSDPDNAEQLLKNAFDQFYHLNQRIKKELKSDDLSKERKSAYHATLDDPFLNGLLKLRRLAVHKKLNDATLFQAPDGSPRMFSADVSAGEAFVVSVFRIPGSNDVTDYVDCLREGISRFKKYLGD